MPFGVSSNQSSGNRYVRGFNPRIDRATVVGFVPRPYRTRFNQARFDLYLLRVVEDKQRGYLLRGWIRPEEAMLLVFN